MLSTTVRCSGRELKPSRQTDITDAIVSANERARAAQSKNPPKKAYIYVTGKEDEAPTEQQLKSTSSEISSDAEYVGSGGSSTESDSDGSAINNDEVT